MGAYVPTFQQRGVSTLMGIYWRGSSGVREQGSRNAFIAAHECGCHDEWSARECPLCPVERPESKAQGMAQKLLKDFSAKMDNFKYVRRYMLDELQAQMVELVGEIRRGR